MLVRRPSAAILDWVGLVARLFLAGVWFLSGSAKAFDPTTARAAVRAYQVLPPDLADVVGLALPWLEIMLGLLLLLGVAVRLTAVFSAVLLVIFIAGVVSAAARGLSIDCGCFGGGGTIAAGQTRYTEEVLRDVGFLVVALYLAVRPSSRWSVDGLLRTRTLQEQDTQ